MCSYSDCSCLNRNIEKYIENTSWKHALSNNKSNQKHTTTGQLLVTLFQYGKRMSLMNPSDAFVSKYLLSCLNRNIKNTNWKRCN